MLGTSPYVLMAFRLVDQWRRTLSHCLCCVYQHDADSSSLNQIDRHKRKLPYQWSVLLVVCLKKVPDIYYSIKITACVKVCMKTRMGLEIKYRWLDWRTLQKMHVVTWTQFTQSSHWSLHAGSQFLGPWVSSQSCTIAFHKVWTTNES